MWIFFGTKSRNRPVENGIRCHRFCSKCGATREFEESRLATYFTLYFIPLFPLERGRPVWRCPICDTSYEMQPAEYLHGHRPNTSAHPAPASTIPEPPPEKIIITCVSCQQNMRVPNVTRTILVTCPQCAEQFKVCPRPPASTIRELEQQIDTILGYDRTKKEQLLDYERRQCPTCPEMEIYTRVLEHLHQYRP